MRIKVLVTGASGQLGQSLQAIAFHYPSLDFLFADKATLDVTDEKQVMDFFKLHEVNWCINCAAFTSVDNAEIHQEQANEVNVLGAINLAKACHDKEVKLIHISTDFVFDGLKKSPYREKDETNPLNVYGRTKLKGEEGVKQNCPSHFIFRTSWLYSEFGNNFLNTMLQLATERDVVRVVNNQFGAPTYARDLAEVLIRIIIDDNSNFGIFHYSNQAQISWFEFAKGIFERINSKVVLEPILAKDYATLATRPSYSVLDTSKIREEMNLKTLFWKDSLDRALHHMVDSK